ncbi:hypothetical protein Q9323_15050 [Pseudomonas fulva]|uniref:hypothetical protein n=1 Tax=Pseudomonas fulva TaxID=47880 RepID=UPI0031F64A66
MIQVRKSRNGVALESEVIVTTKPVRVPKLEISESDVLHFLLVEALKDEFKDE